SPPPPPGARPLLPSPSVVPEPASFGPAPPPAFFHPREPASKKMRSFPRLTAVVLTAIGLTSVAASTAFAADALRPIPVHDRPDLRDAINKEIDANLSAWVATYKEMHASPEVSVMEKQS